MPAVRDGVCGRRLDTRPASLVDFARYRLRQRVYPAIVHEPGTVTAGLLCEGLDAALWRRLDDWESELYVRLAVQVRGSDGAALAAYTYVLASRHLRELESLPWSPAEFERLHLSSYLARWAIASS